MKWKNQHLDLKKICTSLNDSNFNEEISRAERFGGTNVRKTRRHLRWALGWTRNLPKFQRKDPEPTE
jgi:hypothetical protein